MSRPPARSATSSTDRPATDAEAAGRASRPGRVSQQHRPAFAHRSVWLIAVVAAVAAQTGGVAPTGIGIVDVAWTALVAVGVVLAAAWAAPWTWLVLGGVALVVGPGAPLVPLAGALVVAVAVVVSPQRRVLGAAIAAVAVVLLAHQAQGSDGLSAALAVTALAPVVLSGWAGAPETVRERLRGALRGVAGAMAALAAIGVVVVVFGSGELRVAVEQAAAGLDAARDGERDLAVDQIEAANAGFERARDLFGSPLAQPLRVVPLVAAHLDALEATGAAGAAVTAQAGDAVALADVQQLRLAGGGVDLGRVRALVEPVEAVAATLGEAERTLTDATDGWLAPPVAAALGDFEQAVADAHAEAVVAAQVVRVAPSLLGGDGPRRYVILVASPAEARDLGGFVANLVELNVDGGSVSLGRNLRPAPLDEADRNQVSAAVLGPDLPDRYRRYRPDRYWQNLSATVDFPTAARTAAAVFEAETGDAVDGVLYFDPHALAALLEFTGPVEVPGLAAPLTAANAVDYLVAGQYAAFDAPGEKAERVETLDAAAEAVFRRVLSVGLPAPRRLAAVLGPVVADGRLRMWTREPGERSALGSLGLDRAFPTPEGGDLLAVTTVNANPSKIDAYLVRDITHAVAFDPATGAVDATTTVVLRNTAPPSGLPPYVTGPTHGVWPVGTNRTALSVHSPFELLGTDVDGQPGAVESIDELGWRRFTVEVSVPPGEEVLVRFRWAGSVAPGTYRLDVVGQPLVLDDRTRVTVAVPKGWTAVAAEGGGRVRAGVVEHRYDGAGRRSVTVEARRP